MRPISCGSTISNGSGTPSPRGTTRPSHEYVAGCAASTATPCAEPSPICAPSTWSRARPETGPGVSCSDADGAKPSDVQLSRGRRRRATNHLGMGREIVQRLALGLPQREQPVDHPEEDQKGGDPGQHPDQRPNDNG